jgi:hypothetical protein
MTIPYGVTHWGIVKYMIDKALTVKQNKLQEPIKLGKRMITYTNSYGFKSRSGGLVYLNKSDIGLLAEALQKVIREDFHSLLTLELYIEAFVKLANKLNVGVLWYPPSKLKVTQHYLASITEKITFYAYNKPRK